MAVPKMLPNILKNLVDGPATRNFPAETRPPFPGARGQIENNIAECIFCGLCAKKCPSGCLEVDKDKGLWAHEPAQCIWCGICVQACPTGSLTQSEKRMGPAAQIKRMELFGTPPRKTNKK